MALRAGLQVPAVPGAAGARRAVGPAVRHPRLRGSAAARRTLRVHHLLAWAPLAPHPMHVSGRRGGHGGYLESRATFGGAVLTNAGSADAVLWKMSADVVGRSGSVFPCGHPVSRCAPRASCVRTTCVALLQATPSPTHEHTHTHTHAHAHEDTATTTPTPWDVRGVAGARRAVQVCLHLLARATHPCDGHPVKNLISHRMPAVRTMVRRWRRTLLSGATCGRRTCTRTWSATSRPRPPCRQGLTLAAFNAQLEDLWDTSLTLELNLSTFGTHPHMGDKVSLS